MSESRFSKSHEWIALDGTVGTVGITDYAQRQIGRVVRVRLPEVGRRAGIGRPIAVVESGKSASDIYSPVSGRIVRVNPELARDPELINSDPMHEGWLFEIEVEDAIELESLVNESEFFRFIRELD
jgi:glycine cleavage system H protein